MVGDLAGFCAATYQRGVPVIQAPTTLVAQVDSAYGGKTGVDLPEAKNYAGAYHMPEAVLVEPGALATLPAGGARGGLRRGGEDRAHRRRRAVGARARAGVTSTPRASGALVFDCARVKIDVVAEDERDSGRRQVLNLGHTVGHAIEAASGYGRYRHGEAVALGPRRGARPVGRGRPARGGRRSSRHAPGCPPSSTPRSMTDAVMAALGRDKKADADGVPFVLLERPGRARDGRPARRGYGPLGRGGAEA